MLINIMPSPRDQIEQHLYTSKMEKNGLFPGPPIPLSEVGIYKVFFPYKEELLEVGYMLSAPVPKDNDFLELTPMEDLLDAGNELVRQGLISSINDFWDAYHTCRLNPELISYSRLSKEECRKLFSPA